MIIQLCLHTNWCEISSRLISLVPQWIVSPQFINFNTFVTVLLDHMSLVARPTDVSQGSRKCEMFSFYVIGTVFIVYTWLDAIIILMTFASRPESNEAGLTSQVEFILQETHQCTPGETRSRLTGNDQVKLFHIAPRSKSLNCLLFYLEACHGKMFSIFRMSKWISGECTFFV